MNDVRLSKLLAVALRHKPWKFDLELDAEGWTPIDDLLRGLQEAGAHWHHVTRDDLERVIANQQKRRYEIAGSQIRALYGHSIAARIQKTPAVPPEVLYHGTATTALDKIMAEGLRPMRRQYVHLALDPAMAAEVGSRKGGMTVILNVQAQQAHAAGVPFYEGNEQVWLADQVPPAYLTLTTPA